MQKEKISDKEKNSIDSSVRRKVIKTGAKTVMVAAAMTQFGGLLGTLDAASLSSKEKVDLI